MGPARRELASLGAVLGVAGFWGACASSHPVVPDLARMSDRGTWNVINSDRRGGLADGLTVATLHPHGGDGPGSNVALALVEGVPFTEGTVDVDLKGGGADAPSFVGVAFGVDDPSAYEAVYFRPFRFRATSPEEAAHAVQYVAWPDHTWRQLREWSSHAYQSAIRPVPDPAGWFHARVEVQREQVLVYVDHATQPCLVVNRLRTPDRGGVGLWVDGYPGSFANLEIIPAPSPAAQAPPPATDWAALVAAPDRSARDRRLDPGRHPAETLAFLDPRPGMRVADLGAGPGYTTELLVRAVGPRGTVYMHNEPTWLPFLRDALHERFSHTVMASPGVIRAELPFEDPLPPQARNLDLIVMNLIYHDVADTKTDRETMNGHVFDALRPGGAYVILDSSAVAGSGVSTAATLHRIDEGTVKSEVIRAGFRLEAEGTFLRNPVDTRDWNAAPDAAEAAGRRGTSDRFALRFIKPLTTAATRRGP